MRWLRAAMGSPTGGRPMWFVREGERDRLWSPCELVLEDGTVAGCR